MTDAKAQHQPPGQRGSAAILAIFISTSLFLMIMSGLTLIHVAKKVIHTQLTYHGQAVNSAHAGLVDALSYFRRQQVQPVTTFSPQLDLLANPPIIDTDDPAIGIVREYEISDLGNVWGRYEVRKTAVRDASAERGKPGTGTIWQIESVGIVYARKDITKAFNQSPNRQLASVVARTEVQRVNLVLPGNAAINARRGDAVTTETRSRVIAGTDIGVLHPPSTGSPILNGPISGSVIDGTASPYLDSIDDVFGVGQRELIGMADLVAYSMADIPSPLPSMTLTVVRGNATFTGTQPLVGTGILVVLGDLTIAADSFSNFNGLIFVTGNYEQNAPSQVSGAIVGHGAIDLKGAGDFSEVTLDTPLLSHIQKEMGQYRFTRSPLLVRN
jgi:hypothetical protein